RQVQTAYPKPEYAGVDKKHYQNWAEAEPHLHKPVMLRRLPVFSPFAFEGLTLGWQKGILAYSLLRVGSAGPFLRHCEPLGAIKGCENGELISQTSLAGNRKESCWLRRHIGPHEPVPSEA